MAGHTAGEPLECYSIPILLEKEVEVDQQGNLVYGVDGKQRCWCGFRIGGGIDQDPSQSIQGYPDKGIYVTHIYENSPASQCGLQLHDKILQLNGNDFTVVTHKQAVLSIQKKPALKMLVYRRGVPLLQKSTTVRHHFEGYSEQSQNLSHLQYQSMPQQIFQQY